MGLIYLDTGAMYRAVTWLIQKENVDIHDSKSINKVLKNIETLRGLTQILTRF